MECVQSTRADDDGWGMVVVLVEEEVKWGNLYMGPICDWETEAHP